MPSYVIWVAGHFEETALSLSSYDMHGAIYEFFSSPAAVAAPTPDPRQDKEVTLLVLVDDGALHVLNAYPQSGNLIANNTYQLDSLERSMLGDGAERDAETFAHVLGVLGEYRQEPQKPIDATFMERTVSRHRKMLDDVFALVRQLQERVERIETRMGSNNQESDRAAYNALMEAMALLRKRSDEHETSELSIEAARCAEVVAKLAERFSR